MIVGKHPSIFHRVGQTLQIRAYSHDWLLYQFSNVKAVSDGFHLAISLLSRACKFSNIGSPSVESAFESAIASWI
jgi:hypothetical protein